MSRLRRLLIATSALLPGLAPAFAGPNGASVVAGSATVQGQGSASVVVNQSSQSAIINWNTFNIGSRESTTINMPATNSVELDRVTGGLGPSQILGSLFSNGRVFLVNPDGILFGQGAKVNVGGLLATTHDIQNSDFMAGRYNFAIPGMPNASIVNEGSITAQTGGFAALVAPGVRNSGTITATLGQIGLASANTFALDFYGDRLIQLNVGDSIANTVVDVATGQPLKSLISNEGTLKADGGRVQITAAAARQVVDSVINNSGVVEADTIGTHNGMIVLEAAGSTKPSGTPTQTVKVSGTLSAAGKRKGTSGGTILVTGENVQVAHASINAAGSVGGGAVLIGGDWGGGNPNKSLVNNPSAYLEPYAVPTASIVSIDAATNINASAVDTGDGGKVVVWSNEATTFYGTIVAQGGAQSGNGGFVETSGHALTSDGSVSTSAVNGTNGTFLLDPLNAIIAATAGSEVITTSSIENALASNNVVVISTNVSGSELGDITVASSFGWNAPAYLVLGANRNITINNGVTITGGPNVSGLTLQADALGTGTGNVIFNGTGKVDFSSAGGGVFIYYNPSGGYASPTNYSAWVMTNPLIQPSGPTAYMLVNSVSDLENMAQNLSGSYALGRDIEASGTAGAGFFPVGTTATPFQGSLDGNGFVIRDLALNEGNTNQGTLGLFGFIGPQGSVNGVNLTSLTMTGGFNAFGPFANYAGGLAGINEGSISGSTVAATINISSGGWIGSLVGYNSGGSITRSAAGGIITDTTSFSPIIGGLVGYNQGSVDQSYWTPSGSSTFGLAGYNEPNNFGGPGGPTPGTGVISNSYALGTFAGSGLVTSINQGGRINNSYATAQSLVGSNIQGGFIFDSYVAGDPQPTPADGSTGVTTAQIEAGVPSGFSSTIWGSSPSINSGYPYLLWQTQSNSLPSHSVVLTPNGSAPEEIPSLPPSASQTGQVNTNFWQPVTFTTTKAGSTPPVISNLSVPTGPQPIGNSGTVASLIPDSFMWTGLLGPISPNQLLNNVKPLVGLIDNLWNGVAPVHDWTYFASQLGLSSEQIKSIADTGFQAAVYLSPTGQPVLVFQSTRLWVPNDLSTDLFNALGAGLGLTPQLAQYSFAAKLAAQVANDYTFQNLTLTGFSLGGGLAAYAGATDKIRAVTFDPTGVSTEKNYDPSYVLNFQMAGDIAQTGGSLIGTTLVFNQAVTDEAAGAHPFLPAAVGSFERHLLAGVDSFSKLSTLPNLIVQSKIQSDGATTYVIGQSAATGQ